MINRKVSMLNAQQGPRLKDDVPATVATNRCVGYEIAMMDERRIFIENKADTMDHEELAPIKSGIDQIRHRPPGGRTERQAAAVRERHGKTVAPRRGTVAQDCLVPHRPQLRQIDLDQHRGNPRQILLGAHAPARGEIAKPGRCADGGAAPRTRRVHGQVPGTRRPGPRHNRPHPHRE